MKMEFKKSSVDGLYYLVFETEYDLNRFRELYPNLARSFGPVSCFGGYSNALQMPSPSPTFDHWLSNFRGRYPSKGQKPTSTREPWEPCLECTEPMECGSWQCCFNR